MTNFQMPAVFDAAPLVPGRPEDRASNARGVLSTAQEQWLGALLSVPRKTNGASLLAATGLRFAELLAKDLAGSSVVTKTGVVEWAPAATAPWQARAGYLARIDGQREPVPVFGAALPGRYVLYTLPFSGAVVGIDAPGQAVLAPTPAHRAAYEALVASLVDHRLSGRGWSLFWLLTAVLAAVPAVLVTTSPTGDLALRLQESAPLPVVLGSLWALPVLALMIAGVTALVRARRRPEEVVGLLTVAVSPAGPDDADAAPSAVVHPLETLWSDSPRLKYTVAIGGRVVSGAKPGLGRILVPGLNHRALFDRRRGRLVQLTVA